MKYTWVFLGALLLPYVAFADVKINEVAWMGTAKSQYSEWIELYNSGEEAASLTGWKLYKAGSETLYTLSKTIPAQGYLLIERTTSSAPDAVEGINDESGPFGASGLKNTGEDLVLKDTAGNVVDSLAYASGWPAGDSSTGKTMQWDGSAWITADGTPGKANAKVSDDTSEESSSNEQIETPVVSGTTTTTQNKSVTMKVPLAPKKPSLVVTVPKAIFQGVPDEYTAVFENADTIRSPQGYFYWNMGDGTTYTQPSLSSVSHTYHYPGTYTVSTAYYASPEAAKPILQSTASAAVLIPSATVEAFNGEAALRVTNNTNKAMDIGQWPLSLTEGIRFLPPLTIVAPKASIVISARMIGVSIIRDPVMRTPDGTAL